MLKCANENTKKLLLVEIKVPIIRMAIFSFRILTANPITINKSGPIKLVNIKYDSADQ